MEDWVTIKTLKAKNPKLSHRELARLVGVSHHTIKTALTRDEPPAYHRAGSVNEQLEPFRDLVFEMANVKRFRGSRILEELRARGYHGGKTAFYRLLGLVKIESTKDCTPYETAPGEQGQFDWSPYTVLFSGILTQVIVFSYINGFSRFQVLDASLAQDQGTVFEAMERGFTESGGVPHRVQTDNAKVFVQNTSRTNFQWNERYLHFCGHYGFEPTRSLPGHPWSKGKVEKPFFYLETHFIAGGAFLGMHDFLTKLKGFQEKVNARVHGTTRVSPEDLIGKDREAFSPLPATRYVGVKEETRKVSSDCLIAYGGSRYSVPWPFAMKQVWVRLSRGYILEVHNQANALVATHTVSLAKKAVVIDKSHYRMPANAVASLERLRVRFRERFPEEELFLEKLLAQKRFNARYHLHHILELSNLYQTEDFARALSACRTYNVFTVRFMAGFLELRAERSCELTANRSPLPLLSGGSTSLVRDLREYRLSDDSELPFIAAAVAEHECTSTMVSASLPNNDDQGV